MKPLLASAIAVVLACAPAVAQDQKSQPVTVPAGTTLIVRMVEGLDSKKSNPGQRFTVTLEADLVAGGKVIAKKGSQAYGMLTNAKSAGRVAGKAELTVELTSILVNNQSVPVVTEPVETKAKKSEGRKTARNVAIGAGIGKAADDDAGKGAAVALGASALTRGTQIQIPAGSVLQFRLLAPLTV